MNQIVTAPRSALGCRGWAAPFSVVFFLLMFLGVALTTRAEDWPTYRHDQRRSGVTGESLDVARLVKQWSWQSPLPPAPAWPDSARWDAYAKLEGLRSMRNYDPVFHPVVVEGRMYFGSNADDSVHCLDLATGEPLWRYTAGGPVRIAPTVYQDRLYFGSDDGCVYAVDAATGALQWKTSVAGNIGEFLNDGRSVSFMPVRTGVLIDPDANTAVVSAGLFPWRSTLIAALDLQTGDVAWTKDLGVGWTIEGAMLLSPQHLVAPQGRAAPQLFERTTGESQGALPGGGGSFVILTDDDQVLHGPGNKGGWITASDTNSKEKVASFEKGSAVVVRGEIAYLLDLERLSAFDRQSGAVIWTTEYECPHELILAGDTLIAGGDDLVVAFDVNSGRPLWQGEVEGRAEGLVVANGHLVVSTDTGQLTVFAPTGPPAEPPAYAGPQRAPTLPDGEAIEIVAVEDEGLLERWVFNANAVAAAASSSDTTPDAGSETLLRIDPQVESGHTLTLPAGSRLVQAGTHQAWLLSGNVDCEVANNYESVTVPEQDFTVEAWVRIDQGQSWGGLLSVAQDNGSYEKGWIVGFRDQRFGFAVNGAEGPDRLTWVIADRDFVLRGWHHVAATYDGSTMKLYVDGELAGQSTEQQGAIVYPPKTPFHLGSYKDDDEQNFTHGMLNEVRLYQRALPAETITAHAAEKRGGFPEPEVLEVPVEPTATPSRGPILNFVRPGVAQVQWWTEQPQATRLTLFRRDDVLRTWHEEAAVTHHLVEIDGIRRDELLTYQLTLDQDGQTVESRVYECDGHFDYLRPTLPESKLSASAVATASEVLQAAQLSEDRGMAVVIGAGDDGELAEALCRLGGLDVIVVDRDADRVAQAREALLERGVYGRPVSVRHLSDQGANLPKRFADLVVPLELSMAAAGRDEIAAWLRWLQPGGIAVLPPESLPATLSETGFDERATVIRIAGSEWQRYEQPRFEGAQPWTHMYATPDNSAYAGETLSGVRSQADLQVQWAGRPGPRYQSDRGNRKPAPLAAGGRLYMQGLYRVIALNAHNGTILWSWEFPEVVRFNVPRDCSNWCADEERVYITAKDRCLVLNGATGKIESEHPVYQEGDRPLSWGYLARVGDLLLGSGVQSDAPFTEYWGGESWYDAKEGEHAKKVCSEVFFARDPVTGQLKWTYQGGLIVNPTVTVAEGRIHFLECRSEVLAQAESRRLDGEEFWSNLHLVTLDAATGQRLWEIPAQPMPGESALYLAAGEGRLVLQTSKGGAFAVYALDAASGKQLWRGKYDWEANHHGKHLSRPAIVEGKIYLRPLTLALEDGTVLSQTFPVGHQCGTYTASRDALFLRAGSLAVWDRESGDSSRWNRARPDCWISTIPAEGMLLSPEGGGGCSCGGWIETSMGLIPVQVD